MGSRGWVLASQVDGMGSDLGKGSECLGRCGGEPCGTGVRCPKAGAKSRRQPWVGSRAAHTVAGLCLGAGGQPCPVLCFFSPKANGSIPPAPSSADSGGPTMSEVGA